MKKEHICHHYCEECQIEHTHLSFTEIICDVCGGTLSHYGYLICEVGKNSPISLTINGIEYDFCNYKCLLKFILGELQKEKPNDLIYGEEK